MTTGDSTNKSGKASLLRALRDVAKNPIGLLGAVSLDLVVVYLSGYARGLSDSCLAVPDAEVLFTTDFQRWVYAEFAANGAPEVRVLPEASRGWIAVMRSQFGTDRAALEQLPDIVARYLAAKDAGTDGRRAEGGQTTQKEGGSGQKGVRRPRRK